MSGPLLVAAVFVFTLNLTASAVDFVGSMVPGSQLAVVAGPGTAPTAPQKTSVTERNCEPGVQILRIDKKSGKSQVVDTGTKDPRYPNGVVWYQDSRGRWIAVPCNGTIEETQRKAIREAAADIAATEADLRSLIEAHEKGLVTEIPSSGSTGIISSDIAPDGLSKDPSLPSPAGWDMASRLDELSLGPAKPSPEDGGWPDPFLNGPSVALDPERSPGAPSEQARADAEIAARSGFADPQDPRLASEEPKTLAQRMGDSAMRMLDNVDRWWDEFGADTRDVVRQQEEREFLDNLYEEEERAKVAEEKNKKVAEPDWEALRIEQGGDWAEAKKAVEDEEGAREEKERNSWLPYIVDKEKDGGVKIGDAEKEKLFGMKVGQECAPPYQLCSEAPGVQTAEAPKEPDWKAITDTRTPITRADMDAMEDDIFKRRVKLLENGSEEDITKLNAEKENLDKMYYVPSGPSEAELARSASKRIDEEAERKLAAIEAQAKQDRFETMVSQNLDSEDAGAGSSMRGSLATAEAKEAREAAREKEIAESVDRYEAEPGKVKVADERNLNTNFGYPIDPAIGAEQCVSATNIPACSSAYVEFEKARSRQEVFGGTITLADLESQPAPRVITRAPEESNFEKLKKDRIFGPAIWFVGEAVPNAYNVTKDSVAGWYDLARVAVLPTPEPSFAQREQDAFVQNQIGPENAVSEQLLREGQRRLAEAPPVVLGPPSLASSEPPAPQTQYPITPAEQAEFDRGPVPGRIKTETNQNMFSYYIYTWTPYRFKQTMQWFGF